MNISQRFNGFFHAILTEAFAKARQISFRDWKDTNTGGCLTFYRGEDYFDTDELKQLLKLLNLNYPITQDREKKTSTRDITDGELCRHIVWFTKILNQNGIEFEHDVAEYEEVKRKAGI